MTLTASAIAAKLPHGPGILQLDRVLAWDSTRLMAETLQHQAESNPLRNAAGRLPATAALEIAGQAMALHGALLEGTDSARPRRGYLVVARHLHWQRDRLDEIPDTLQVAVQQLSASPQGAVYAFELRTQKHPELVTGQLTVMYPE